MNEIAKDRITGQVVAAIKKEELTASKAADYLGIAGCYMSFLSNHKYDKIPDYVWDSLRSWVNSGEKISARKRLARIIDPPKPVGEESFTDKIVNMKPGEDKALPDPSIPVTIDTSGKNYAMAVDETPGKDCEVAQKDYTQAVEQETAPFLDSFQQSCLNGEIVPTALYLKKHPEFAVMYKGAYINPKENPEATPSLDEVMVKVRPEALEAARKRKRPSDIQISVDPSEVPDGLIRLIAGKLDPSTIRGVIQSIEFTISIKQ